MADQAVYAVRVKNIVGVDRIGVVWCGMVCYGTCNDMYLLLTYMIEDDTMRIVSLLTTAAPVYFYQ